MPSDTEELDSSFYLVVLTFDAYWSSPYVPEGRSLLSPMLALCCLENLASPLTPRQSPHHRSEPGQYGVTYLAAVNGVKS